MVKPMKGFERPDLPETHYLDNRIFTDDAIFAAEQQRIFSKVWQKDFFPSWMVSYVWGHVKYFIPNYDPAIILFIVFFNFTNSIPILRLLIEAVKSSLRLK